MLKLPTTFPGLDKPVVMKLSLVEPLGKIIRPNRWPAGPLARWPASGNRLTPSGRLVQCESLAVKIDSLLKSN
jgi:hypothetical protein